MELIVVTTTLFIQFTLRKILIKKASSNYQRNYIKIMLMFAEFIERQNGLNLTQINSSIDILLFLDSRKRNREQDPDQK